MEYENSQPYSQIWKLTHPEQINSGYTPSHLTSSRPPKTSIIYVGQYRNIICKHFTSEMPNLAPSQAYLGG
jgi:hypothetical protein